MSDLYETAVDFYVGNDFATYFSSDPRTIKRMRELAAEHPDEVVVLHDDGHGLQVSVPIKWWREPRPPIKRNFTEEQRQAMADRMRGVNRNTKKEH